MLHPGSSVPALLLGPSHFSEGRTPGPPFPSLHAPGTQIQRPGLTTCRPGSKCLLFRVRFQSAPRRRKGKLGMGVGGGNPDQTPDPSPHWSPGHLPCWAKEDFVRSLRAPGGGGWEQQERAGGSLLPRPSVRPSVPQATALSLESTLSSKGCSTPLWERRNECSPWLPARVGMPWSAHYPMPVPSGPGPSHWARRDSGACSVLPLRCFPPAGSSSIPPFSLPPPDLTPFISESEAAGVCRPHLGSRRQPDLSGPGEALAQKSTGQRLEGRAWPEEVGPRVS